MSLRSTLFAGKRRTVLVGSLAVVGLVVAGVVTGVLGVPAVEAVDNEFGAVTENHTDVHTAFVVSNPNPVGLRLGDASVDYTVSLAGLPMANGTQEGIGLREGNTTIRLVTSLENDRIPDWWVKHLQNGERSEVSVDATVSSGLLGRSVARTVALPPVETDILGGFNQSADQPVGENTGLGGPVAVIRQQNATFGSVNSDTTPMNVTFRVYNPNSVPVTVAKLGYDLRMNDVPMGAGEVQTTTVIPPKATRPVNAIVKMDNEHLDEWWVSHLQNDQQTDLVVDFYATVSVADQGTLEIPLRNVTYEHTIETAIFASGDLARNPPPNATPAGNGTVTRDGNTTGNGTAAENGTATGNGTAAGGTATGDGTTTDTTGADGDRDSGSGTTTDDGLLDRRPPTFISSAELPGSMRSTQSPDRVLLGR